MAASGDPSAAAQALPLRPSPSVTFVEPPRMEEPQSSKIRYSQIFKSMYNGTFMGSGSTDAAAPDTTSAADQARRAFDSNAQPAKPAMKQPGRSLLGSNSSSDQYPFVGDNSAATRGSAPFAVTEPNPGTGVAYQTRGGAALASALGVGAMPIPLSCPPALPPTSTTAPLAGSQPPAVMGSSSNAMMSGPVTNPLTAPELPYMNMGSPSQPRDSLPSPHWSDDDVAPLQAPNGSGPSHLYGPPEPAPYKSARGIAHATVQLAPINTGAVGKPSFQPPHTSDLLGQQQQHRDQGQLDGATWQQQHGAAAAPGSPDGVGAAGSVASGGGGGDDDGASTCQIIPPGSQTPLPLFWSQLTFRAVLVGLLVGCGFLLLNMRLALVTGVTPNLQVVMAGGCWALLRGYTQLFGRDMPCIPVLTAQEVAVAASAALALSNSAAAGGFGTVLLALQGPIAQRVGSSVQGNLPSLVWSLGYWRMVAYMAAVGLGGALLMLPFRRPLFARPSMTFATGAAAGQLLNTLHTPAMSYHGHKQMHRFTQWSVISFVFSGYQWVFNNPSCNGFKHFPTFGLQALRYTWNFDFQLPFVGLGILAPVSVAWSLIVGGLLSWGLLWPVLSSKEGVWFPAALDAWDVRGAYGYQLVVAMALLLADSLYHMVKGVVLFVMSRNFADGCTNRDIHDPSERPAGPAHGRHGTVTMDELEQRAAMEAAAGPGPGLTKRKKAKRRHAWRQEALRIIDSDTLSDASSLQFSMAAMERALRQHIFIADGAMGWVGLLGFAVFAGVAVVALPNLFSMSAATAAGGASQTAAAATSSLKYYHSLIAAVLAAVAALANARGAGVTDINMADVYAKLGMLVFSAWAGQGVASSGAGLVCGGLLLGASSSAVSAMYAWRAGFMTMASPTAVFIAHMIGLGVGCFAAPAAWLLFDTAATNGGVLGGVSASSLLASDGFFASPVAAVFRATAVLAGSGVSALPMHALWVALSALVAGLALNGLRDTLPVSMRGIVPIPAAVGVVCLSGASIAVDLAVGAAARIFWRLRYPRSADAYATVVGCALIAGEGMWGLGKGLLAAFGVRSPICMTFTLAPAA